MDMTLQEVETFVVFITLLISLYFNVKKLNEPHEKDHDNIKTQIDDLKSKQDDFEEKQINDYKHMKEIKADNAIMAEALMRLLNHEIDGNGIKDMKKTRDKLQSHLLK